MRKRPLSQSAALLAGAAAVLAGCTSGTTAAKPAPSRPAPARTTPSATPSASTPAPTPAPTAKDGRHVERCADARCEVLIKHGTHLPLSAYGYQDIYLKPTSGDETTIRIVHDNGVVSSGYTGGDAEIDIDKLRIKITPVGKGIIVHVSHGPASDSDSLSSSNGGGLTTG